MNNTISHGSTNTDYLLRRLARDFPEILDAFERGEYPSVRQAAIAAGIVSVPSALDRLRKAWRAATPEERAVVLAEAGGSAATTKAAAASPHGERDHAV